MMLLLNFLLRNWGIRRLPWYFCWTFCCTTEIFVYHDVCFELAATQLRYSFNYLDASFEPAATQPRYSLNYHDASVELAATQLRYSFTMVLLSKLWLHTWGIHLITMMLLLNLLVHNWDIRLPQCFFWTCCYTTEVFVYHDASVDLAGTVPKISQWVVSIWCSLPTLQSLRFHVHQDAVFCRSCWYNP